MAMLGSQYPSENAPASHTSCKICSGILELHSRPNSDNYISLGLVESFLDDRCVGHQDLIQSMEWKDGGFDDYKHREIHYWSISGMTSACLWISSLDGSRSKHMELAYKNDRSGHTGRGLILDPEWIDDNLLAEWKSACMEEHGSQCDHSFDLGGSDVAKPAWLIDTIAGCLVPGSGQRYISLTYKWGQTPTLENTKESLGKLRESGVLYTSDVEAKIPQTIKDAIKVVKALDERYLWVDALCIVQDDEEMRIRDIHRMHGIYASSYITIVAADGLNADFGLRGLRGLTSPRDLNQTIFDLKNDEHLIVPKFRTTAMRRNNGRDTYYDRAWTYQEYMFAKRRLIFEDGSIRWECQRAGWFEDCRRFKEEDSPTPLFAARALSTKIPSLKDITYLAGEYNQKNLTFPEDAMSAFSGIQTLLSQTFEGGFLFGLPGLFFDIALMWSPNSHLTRRQPSQRSLYNSSLTQLPSWSWVGWAGEFFFPFDLEYEPMHMSLTTRDGYLSPVTTWYTLESVGAPRRRIISKWNEGKQMAQDTTIPLYDGWERRDYVRIEDGDERKAKQPFPEPRIKPKYYFFNPLHPERKYWYPVHTNTAGWDKPAIKEMTPLLFGQTTGCTLYADTRLAHAPWLPSFARYKAPRIKIRNSDGALVGDLHLHTSSDLSLFKDCPSPGKPIELVAICKGWSTKILDTEEARAQYYSDRLPEPLDIGVNIELKAFALDCYFVLWIEWVDGIAYRRAGGCVEAEFWGRKASQLDLVLG